jgi:hypothetical protein
MTPGRAAAHPSPPDLRRRFRCAHCHARQAQLAPDGFTDCSGCGRTSRPRAIVRIKGRCVAIDLSPAVTAAQLAEQLQLL